MLHVSRVQERQHHPPRFLVTSEPPPPPPPPGVPKRNSRSVVLWIPGSTWSLTPAPTWRCIRNQPGRGREVAASSPSKKEIPQIKDELNGFPGTKEIEMSTNSELFLLVRNDRSLSLPAAAFHKLPSPPPPSRQLNVNPDQLTKSKIDTFLLKWIRAVRL